MFKIYHFYKSELNLYGDSGNILYLQYFLKLFGIDSSVYVVDKSVNKLDDCDFIFAGGGPDLLQNSIFDDFLSKKEYLKNHIESGKPALFICGSFQLLGKYYLTSQDNKIPGLSLFDFYTFSPKNQKNRIVGNIKADLNFESSFYAPNIVGFENHNGRTILNSLEPFSRTGLLNKGNNDTDDTEGLLYKKTIGTYFHGPLLVKNPHILYFLLEKYLPKNFKIDERLFASEYVSFKNALQKSI